MDRQQIIDFAQRMRNARDNDARMQEVMRLAPDSALSRLGLQRQSSLLGSVLAYGGAMALGALVGASAALLLAPTSGEEMRNRVRRQAKRVSRDVKKATENVEQAVSGAREQISALTNTSTASMNGKSTHGRSTNGHAKRTRAHA
jgi:gas vesicle protein